MKKQKLLALSILATVIVWMTIPRGERQTTGQPQDGSTPKIEISSEGSSASENPGGFTVRAQQVTPEKYVRQIRGRGRTQAFRHVEVRAEEAGRIVKEPVRRGARVSQGLSLIHI